MCFFRKVSVSAPASARVSVDRLHVGQQARAGVHGQHILVHAGHLFRRGVHDQVGALLHDGQVVVGDETGDLDDGVACRIEPRHLEIDPGQHARACYRSCPGRAVGARPCNVRRCCASLCTSSTPAWRCPATHAKAMPAPTSWPAPTWCWPAGAAGPWSATGVALAIPVGYAGLVLPRSGLALRHGVTCLNAPGLVDSGYRGELRVVLVNHDPEHDYPVSRGDRIAQLVLVRIEQADFELVAEEGLGGSERGGGGFGHTGT